MYTKGVIAAASLIVILTGCANGIIADQKYQTCEGYEEYRKAAIELGGARPDLISLRKASHRAIPEEITVTEGNVTRTFLVNPLDEEVEELSQKVAKLQSEVDAFQKKCSPYKW